MCARWSVCEADRAYVTLEELRALIPGMPASQARRLVNHAWESAFLLQSQLRLRGGRTPLARYEEAVLALELGEKENVEQEGPTQAETKEGQEEGVLASEAEPDPPPDPPPFEARELAQRLARLEELLVRAAPPEDLQLRLGRLETAAPPRKHVSQTFLVKELWRRNICI